MRLLLIAIALCLVASTAHAQKSVASGKPLILYRATSINPDCSADGTVTIRVAEPPEHGRVSIRSKRIFPNFPESNPRHRCNSRGVTGAEATYTSRRGYTGSDRVALEIIYPSGRYTRGSVNIEVR